MPAPAEPAKLCSPGASSAGNPAAAPSADCTGISAAFDPILLPVTIPAARPSTGTAKGAIGPSAPAAASASAPAMPDPTIQRASTTYSSITSAGRRARASAARARAAPSPRASNSPLATTQSTTATWDSGKPGRSA